MKFVKHSLYRRLLLKKPLLKKELGRVKPRNYPCKFLYHCLVNCFFPVSKDEGISLPHLLRRRNHALKPLERFV